MTMSSSKGTFPTASLPVVCKILFWTSIKCNRLVCERVKKKRCLLAFISLPKTISKGEVRIISIIDHVTRSTNGRSFVQAGKPNIMADRSAITLSISDKTSSINKSEILSTMRKKSLENIVGKGENTCSQ